MMTRKRIYNKGRKLLAGALSVLLGLSLYMSDTPLTAQAADTPDDIIEEVAIMENEDGNYTVTITLKCGEEEADASVYDALTIKENEDSETIYTLTDKKVVLPAGTYYIYLNEKPLAGSEPLIVGKDTVTDFEISYCTISFLNGDQEIECWSVTKGYLIPTDRLEEITLAQEGFLFKGWSTDPAVPTPVDWTLPVAEDMIVYAVWEAETPPCEHQYIWCTSAEEHWMICELCEEFSEEPPAPHTFADSWSTDEVCHWHECICGALNDTTAHTESDWIIDKEATLTEIGSRHKECTVCKRLLQTQEIPKIEPRDVHEHKYSEDWKLDETHHWHVCTAEGECDTPEADKEEHTFDEGKITKEATEEAEGEKLYTCTACGYEKTEVIDKLEHKHKFSEEWQSDDISHWHVCACGTKNDIKPHTAGDWITDKNPTVSAEGSRHQECTTCKKVLKTEAIAKLVAPKITAGVGQIYHPGSGKDLTITCSGSLEDLTGVYVDNGSVHKSNYTVASGSTVLTLKSAYLDSLAGGTHTLKLAYSNGTSAETTFTIQKTNAVKTGDTTNYIPLVILLILSGGVLIVTTVIRKRGFNG